MSLDKDEIYKSAVKKYNPNWFYLLPFYKSPNRSLLHCQY
jgi:hypothetical protein